MPALDGTQCTHSTQRDFRSGVLGHVYSVLHLRRGFQDQPGSWYVQLPHQE